MDDDAEIPDELELRKRFFEWAKAWAEKNLSGELRDPAVPPIHPYGAYPVWLDMRSQLESIESSIRKLNHSPDERSFHCPFVDGGGGPDSGVTQLVTGPGLATRSDGIKEIRDFTRDAVKLVIVDPYAYGGEGASAKKYVDELCKAARVGGKALKALHIIFSSSKGQTKAIQDELACRAYAAKVRLSDSDTDLIHDRIWIADGNRGLVAGTSFGGLGARASFLLPLPPSDLAHIQEFLEESGFLRGPVRRWKPAKVKDGKKRRTTLGSP
ncbi:MAG: hypothetical protein HOO96_40440 [Polyangiaceae bacterium]|nr:hypothetical protein [Polyangiaceae bacterium]